MKTSYFVLWYLITACGAENRPKFQKIDPSLLGYYEEFKADCAKSFRAEACDARLPWVSRVEFSEDLPPETLGLASTRYGDTFEIVVQINPDTPDVRMTMYHELGHAIGIDHMSNSCIMDEYLQSVEAWGGWDKCKYVFFNVK